MVTNQNFRKLALAYPGAVEQPHFEKTSFRVKKKIFATLDEKNSMATMKFSPVDQSVFTDISKGAMFPAQGAWGKSGYTYVNLKTVKIAMLKDAMRTSYATAAPIKPTDEIGRRK
jgi:predicted DNA-binding protein (MmcQ/YjbR family)